MCRIKKKGCISINQGIAIQYPPPHPGRISANSGVGVGGASALHDLHEQVPQYITDAPCLLHMLDQKRQSPYSRRL